MSVFAEVGAADLDWISTTQLPRARRLVLFQAGDMYRSGLQLWDLGQSPHYDVA